MVSFGGVRQIKKITIWSQGIDSLSFNALIARAQEVTGVETVPSCARRVPRIR